MTAPEPSVSILLITPIISFYDSFFNPVNPWVNSSIVKTPSPFLSNYLNNFPNSVISYSDNYDAIYVNVTYNKKL